MMEVVAVGDLRDPGSLDPIRGEVLHSIQRVHQESISRPVSGSIKPGRLSIQRAGVMRRVYHSSSRDSQISEVQEIKLTERAVEVDDVRVKLAQQPAKSPQFVKMIQASLPRMQEGQGHSGRFRSNDIHRNLATFKLFVRGHRRHDGLVAGPRQRARQRMGIMPQASPILGFNEKDAW